MSGSTPFSWDFNAPSYYKDFSSPYDDEEENPEQYFEMNHENEFNLSLTTMEENGNSQNISKSSGLRQPLKSLQVNNTNGVNLASALSSIKPAKQRHDQEQDSMKKMKRRSNFLRKWKEQQAQEIKSPVMKKPRTVQVDSRPPSSNYNVLPNIQVPESNAIAKESTASNFQRKGSVTRPKPFHFATDARVGNKEAAKDTKSESSDFIAGLRRYSPLKNAHAGWKTSVVIPQPFAVASKKRKLERQNDFVSLAEQIKAFHLKTPERWKGKKDGSVISRNSYKKSPTKPQSPKFHYQARQRPVNYLSKEQQEQQQAEEMKKHQFKARPVNRKIFLTPTGLRRKPQPSPASSLPDKAPSAQIRRCLDKPFSAEERPVFQFKAQPVPVNILQKVMGVKPKERLPMTNPKTPPFLLKQREEAWEKMKLTQKEKEEAKKAEVATASHPITSDSISSTREKCTGKQPTVLQPFSFDQHDAERMARKWQHIKEMQEKEAQIKPFKAQLLPPDSPRGIPPKAPRSPTKPEPFHLELELRGQDRAEKWKRQIEEELEKMKATAEFKAHPCTVLKKPQFVPEPSSRELTEPHNVELNTARRAEERKIFMQEQLEKEKFLEEIKRQREEELQKREQEAIAELRKQTVHKAQPVPQYKPLVIHPSDKELTIPQTPNLRTKHLRSKKEK